MNMDDELRHALRRKQAPADLADRVLTLARQSSERATAARISTSPAATVTSAPTGSHRVLRWLAAAAVIGVTIGGAERYYTQQRAAEAERVQEELRIALQITSEALAHVQSKLSEPAHKRGR